MIAYDLADNRLLCLNQTSHALMAAVLCRYWGNAHFAAPVPYDVVMMAIAQHDNGWWEWEQVPLLRADGYPMDFLHGPSGQEKLAIWRRGISRAAAQHPYAGVLIWRHALLLYNLVIELGMIKNAGERQAITDFAREYESWLAEQRRLFAHDAEVSAWLSDAAIEANTRLLQFGDFASLQVTMGWPSERVISSPVDANGTFVDIVLHHEGDHITFDPWPFSVDSFTLSIYGRLLEQRTFPDHAAFQAALSTAPYHALTWHVHPV